MSAECLKLQLTCDEEQRNEWIFPAFQYFSYVPKVSNLLEIAVHMLLTTTSTNVHIFALAIANSAISVCGIVLTFAIIGLMKWVIFIYIFNLSATVSMFLVKMFSTPSDERLIIIVEPATIFTTLGKMTKFMRYRRFIVVFETCMRYPRGLILITCYTLMAAAPFNTIRASRNQVCRDNRQLQMIS